MDSVGQHPKLLEDPTGRRHESRRTVRLTPRRRAPPPTVRPVAPRTTAPAGAAALRRGDPVRAGDAQRHQLPRRGAEKPRSCSSPRSSSSSRLSFWMASRASGPMCASTRSDGRARVSCNTIAIGWPRLVSSVRCLPGAERSMGQAIGTHVAALVRPVAHRQSRIADGVAEQRLGCRSVALPGQHAGDPGQIAPDR